MNQHPSAPVSCLPALLAVPMGAVFMALSLGSESQGLVFGLLLGGSMGLGLAHHLGWLDRAGCSAAAWPRTFGGAVLVAVAGVCLWFHDDPFVLFLIATVLVYTLACFGLNLLSYTQALKKLPISLAYPLMVSIGYLIILIVSWSVFGERLAPVRYAGAGLMIVGLWLLVR